MWLTPQITIFIGGINHSQSWLVSDIVSATLIGFDPVIIGYLIIYSPKWLKKIWYVNRFMIPPHLMPSCNLATPVFRAALRARDGRQPQLLRGSTVTLRRPRRARAKDNRPVPPATSRMGPEGRGQTWDLPAENGGE